MNVPYLKVLGNAFFEDLTQLECVCPTFTWAELEPYLWGFDDGVWTPDDLTLPLGDSVLRFKDITSTNYLELGLIFSEMDPSPILYLSQHLFVKKDFSCGGMIGSNQGCLNLGSGLQADWDMPQIVLGHSEAAYGSMDTLEINRSGIGTLHRARSSNIATIGTSSAHLLVAGDKVKIHSLGGTGYNGEWYVLAVPNSTHFTYNNTGGNEGETASLYGSITGLAKLKVKTAYVDSLLKVNGDAWTFAWDGGTVTNPITITSTSEPLLTLNHADAKIEFLNDCDLYRKVVSSVPILATDNAFTCGALTCLGIAGSNLGLSIADGTAPITVTSTTKCTNLNADRLDDHHSTDFLGASATATDSDKLDGHHWSDVPAAWNGGTITNSITINHTGAFIEFKDFTLYRQTSPALCLELDVGMIIDGALQVGAGLAVTGAIGATTTITANNLWLTSAWSAHADATQSEISNDVTNYKTLMIIGNTSAGGVRSVSIWDKLTINGTLQIGDGTGALAINHALNLDGDVILNSDIHLHNSATGVLQVLNANGDCATLDASLIFVDHINSLSSGGVTFFDNVRPYPNSTLHCGTNTQYWEGVWADYLKYHSACSVFDALDDLALVKNYKSKKMIDKNGLEIDVIDPNSLPHLLDENGFHDPARDTGFLLGCVKQLIQRNETLVLRIEKLEGKNA
jgi:hypothetical protein